MTSLSADPRYLAKVLVVDDNRTDAAMLEAMLQGFGCRVDISSGGYEAVTSLEKHYDLVFLDINMPHLSGLDIAGGVKGTLKNRLEVPIILVSGENFTHEMEEKCILLGVEGYVQKPARKQEIRRVLETFLKSCEIELLRGQGRSPQPRGFIRKRHQAA